MKSANIFLHELILFSLTQLLGIFVAYRYWFYLMPEGLATEVDFKFSYADIFIILIFLLVFILISVKKGRAAGVFFKIFFWLVIFSGSQAVFYSFVPSFWASVFALVLVFLMSKVRQVWLQNLGVVLGIAGIGAIVGLSLEPMTAVFILVGSSVYDIFTVYLTGHMVKMAQTMIQAGAIFGLVIPSDFSGFKEKMSGVQPGERFMILGSGDVALPLILTASLAVFSLWQALAVAGFSMLGLLITHILFVKQKERKPMAALPPIAAMSIIGYLITSFLW